VHTDQRRRLESVRLASALASRGVEPSSVKESASAIGPAVVVDGAGWLVAVEHEHHALSVGLLWAHDAGVDQLNLVVGVERAPTFARRARSFSLHVVVWAYRDNALVEVVPIDHEPRREVPTSHERFASLIADCGVDVVREHGVLTGEVLGLEVCRVVDDPDSTDGVRLEIGVGAHDRETFRLVHGALATGEQLIDVARTVTKIRSDAAAQHPLARLGIERLLRSRVVASPGLVGARTLRIAEPPVRRDNVKDPVPCVAIGELTDGSPLVVACTAIADLDVVAFGADARDRLGVDGELVIVTAPGNVTPSIRRLAGLLERPANFHEVATHGD